MLSFFLTVLESAADRRLFASIYEQHHSKMERIAINMLKNQGDAEDAVQNAFMQVIRNFEKINQIPSEELPFWIISIVKNECYMILRKQKRVVLVCLYLQKGLRTCQIMRHWSTSFQTCRIHTGRFWR